MAHEKARSTGLQVQLASRRKSCSSSIILLEFCRNNSGLMYFACLQT